MSKSEPKPTKTTQEPRNSKDAQHPNNRIKLGTLLVSIDNEAGCLTEDEARVVDKRDQTPADPMPFDRE